MKWILLLLALLPVWPASAHVGSPNVFFEGQAGPYPVRVVIRPPAVLPGLAQLDIRAGGASNVVIQATLWNAGVTAAPDPVPATLVTGETNQFSAAVWLFYSGAYGIQVTLKGARGDGTAIVPLNAAATRNPTMSPGTKGVLGGLGILLFVGAVWFARIAALNATREPGEAPTRRDFIHAGRVTVGAALLLSGALYAGKVRWQLMDAEFRNNALYKPQPVNASVRTNGDLRILQLKPPGDPATVASWDTLVADHGKLMHLFLLRLPEFNAFAHLHPVRRDARTFEAVLPNLPAGEYRLYAEVTHESGLNDTLTATLKLPGPTGPPPRQAMTSASPEDVICQSPILNATGTGAPLALDRDDSWHTSLTPATTSSPGAHVRRLMGGCQIRFESADQLMENRDTSLRFTVLTADGQPARLQPYMGMMGHAVLTRSDGEVFTHLHPAGTISMAAMNLFSGGMTPTNAPPRRTNQAVVDTVNEIAFPYAFPRAGPYRLWAQVRIADRVLTGVFDVDVKPAR